jgi:hypothetical protein
MVDFHEIQQGGHVTDIDVIFFLNPVSSTIPRRQTFKRLRWMQNLHLSKWDHEILNADRASKDKQLWLKFFSKEIKVPT